jgi:endo-1,4-beta-xylanase
MVMDITRRQMLLASLVASAFPAVAAQTQGSLKAAAAGRNLIYGAAVTEDALGRDPQYTELLAREAGMLVAEGVMKRKTLQPKQDVYNFAPAERIWRFAQANAQTMRGHTLVWHLANPHWLEGALADKPSERILTDYIQKVAGHFRGRLHSWDVVNEAIEPDEGEESGLRANSPWYQAFGPAYIEIAFRAARDADPNALLFYNELNLEGDVWWAEKRRTATLKMLEGLLKKGVPIDGLGIQSHLKAYRVNYDDDVFGRFLEEVSALGLKVLLTEFDIADIDGPDDPAQRDADIAALARRYLSTAFANKDVLGCLTWGISDRYSWLSRYDDYKWADGQFSRVLPFSEQLSPKPMQEAMLAAYKTR